MLSHCSTPAIKTSNFQGLRCPHMVLGVAV
jgi:hypothetical protein